MRKVCVVSGNRSDYARLRTVLAAIKARPDLELSLVVIGSHLLPDFGTTVQQIREDGFPVFACARTTIEGEDPASMAKSIGLGIMELTTVLDIIKPDVVLVSGDRFEILSAVVAAAAMNIHVAHLQGGEVTGSFDESVRHAVTKMAHLHFPATEGSRQRILRMGEVPERIHLVGCPSIDVVAGLAQATRQDLCKQYLLKPGEPYVIVAQHPVTTEFTHAGDQMYQTLLAVKEVGLQGIFIYPNVDAGSERMIRMIHRMTEQGRLAELHMYKHIALDDFLGLVRHAACIVGNSSVAIREGSYIGIPAVNVGSRQHRRERGKNVVDVPHEATAIVHAMREQIAHGPYPSDHLYGNGMAGTQVARILAETPLGDVQKTLVY